MNKVKRRNILTNWQLILISTAVFLVLILYLDGSNMRYKKSLDARLEDLTGQRDSLRGQIERDSIMIERLNNDDKFLERYAREHYYMKQEDEDLFVFE